MSKITERDPLQLTESEYHEHEDSLLGVCVECRANRGDCEPDAAEYPCEECGGDSVYGVPELLMMGLVEILED